MRRTRGRKRDSQPEAAASAWEKVAVPLAVAAIALVAGGVGAVLGYWGKDREMDVKMVEIAVGILSQEPKDNIAPAREWAVDLITKFATVKPSPEVRAALISNRAVLANVSNPLAAITTPIPSGCSVVQTNGTVAFNCIDTTN